MTNRSSKALCVSVAMTASLLSAACATALPVNTQFVRQTDAAELVQVEGILENSGENYFTDFHLELVDATAGKVIVQPWLVRDASLSQGEGERPKTQSDFLGHRVRLRGIIEEKPLKGLGLVRSLLVVSAEIIR